VTYLIPPPRSPARHDISPIPLSPLSTISSCHSLNAMTRTHPQLGVDLQEGALRHMSVYQQTISPTRLCLDSHHLNLLLLSDEYLHLRTFRSLVPTMVKLHRDNSSLKMGMIGDTRRRLNIGPNRDISSRDKVSMGNNKVDRDMEYQRELDVECKLVLPVDLERADHQIWCSTMSIGSFGFDEPTGCSPCRLSTRGRVRHHSKPLCPLHHVSK
jgi:hypothetical protein